MRLWAERAHDPKQIEYVIAYERSDKPTADHLDSVLPNSDMPWFEGGVVAIRGEFGGSCPAWNAAAQVASGHLLVQVSDDFIPPVDFDLALLARLPSGWEEAPHVIAVSDGHRKDRLLTMLIANQSFCHAEGCFLFPGFKSVWSDGDATFRAYKRGCVIEARDLVFEHRHPFFDNSVAMDETYRIQNDTARYADGENLFKSRHPEWQKSGIVNWV